MSDRNASELTLEEIVDQCIGEIASARLDREQALERWRARRDELAPLLDVAIAMRNLPSIPERAPDADRRAAFMTSIATTAQERPARPLGERITGWFGGFAGAAPRIAAIATPAAAIALVAVFFVLSSGADRASAATLTIFDGVVERNDGGEWVPLSDGATLAESERLRTSDGGVALLTFPDGSTAALDPSTEVILERVAVDGNREIALVQVAGRIWNDVTPGPAASYIVRTPDAVIEAHGTTFETVVRDGETSVVTASGLVEVAAGIDRATLEPGQVLRAAGDRIVDSVPHRSTDAPATLRVDGPFVASLQAGNGAATGALPSGVIYQQLPGVSTTNPGDGPQVIRFYDIAPGRYTLVLRRIEGPRGTGQAILEAGGRERPLELPADLETLRLQVDIAMSDGIVMLTLVEREATSVEPAVRDERIVDSPRTTDAVAVSDQRAAAAPARPIDEVRPTITPTHTDRPVTPPTTTAEAPADRLLAIFDLDEPARTSELRRFLETLGDDQPRWDALRQRLAGNAELRLRFDEALSAIEEPAFLELVRERLGLQAEGSSRPLPTATRSAAEPTPTGVPPSEVTPTATPTDGATRDRR